MDTILTRISQLGAVPVIALDDAEMAVPLALALADGGLPVAEVTFRTAAGESAIRKMAEGCPDVLVGAGTVVTLDQCRRAISAGARFVVSPGYSEEIVACCRERGVTVLPGCANASDLMRAVNAGVDTVKFFPAEQAGGTAFLKAVAPVFPQLKFMPTGGVSLKNLPDYLGLPCVTACGGTWMVKKDLIAQEKWTDIRTACRETAVAVQAILAEKKHGGVDKP